MEQPENYLRPATTKGQVNKYCRIAFDIDCVVKGNGREMGGKELWSTGVSP